MHQDSKPDREPDEDDPRPGERLHSLIYDNSSDCLYLARVEPGGGFLIVSVNETFLPISGYAGSGRARPADGT